MKSLSRRNFLSLTALSPLALGIAQQAHAASHSATTHDVTIQNMAFSPESLTINVGDTVRFTNKDGAPHTATFDAEGQDTGTLSRNSVGELTFASAGTFDYICSIHRAMRGTIVVQ
jgi:plastocyanin